MILKQNENSFVIEDGVGLIKSVSIVIDNSFATQITHVAMKDMMKMLDGQTKDFKGIPTIFAIHEEAPSRTKFLFHPINDSERDVEVTYFPHAKRC